MICSNSDKTAKAAELINQGLSDQAIVNALNAEFPQHPPMFLMAVSRHRRAHVLNPTQHRTALLAKGRKARRAHEQLAAAAASDAPSTQALVEATLGLCAQTEKLSGIESRLERMAAAAEASQSAQGVGARRGANSVTVRARAVAIYMIKAGQQDSPTESLPSSLP